MVETILKVQGMMCGMCESHINEVVRKTAQVSKMSSSHTRGETVIVSEQALDIETLKHTNSQLISTLDEVVKIQDEGRQKRQEAEMELARIEAELKNKLLEISEDIKGLRFKSISYIRTPFFP